MKVGFCGLGIMGSRMAAQVAKAGHEVTAWTRTEGKAQAWADENGARAAATPAEAAEGADVLITMLVDGAQVTSLIEQVPARDDLLFLDMTTIGAPAARQLAQGRRFVDAPVTGSSPRAENGTLTIMVGGRDEDVAQAMPLLQAMGEKIIHMGPVGHGQAIKVIGNVVSSSNAIILAQSLIAGAAAGIDLEKAIEVLSVSSGASTMLDLKARPMLEHDWTTLFKLEHMLKDVRLALEQAHESKVPYPAAADAAQLLEGGMARGLADADFSSVLEVLEGLAGRPVVSP
jgi:3-hydroxyisobutyrate dehydrogenase-like beta-hydroxyacid dehydrogenase